MGIINLKPTTDWRWGPSNSLLATAIGVDKAKAILMEEKTHSYTLTLPGVSTEKAGHHVGITLNYPLTL